MKYKLSKTIPALIRSKSLSIFFTAPWIHDYASLTHIFKGPHGAVKKASNKSRCYHPWFFHIWKDIFHGSMEVSIILTPRSSKSQIGADITRFDYEEYCNSIWLDGIYSFIVRSYTYFAKQTSNGNLIVLFGPANDFNW